MPEHGLSRSNAFLAVERLVRVPDVSQDAEVGMSVVKRIGGEEEEEIE